MRRTIRRANTEDMAWLKDGEGKYITGRDNLIEYVGKYFHELYGPRTSERFDWKWTKSVLESNADHMIDQGFEELGYNRRIAEQEVREVISSLPSGKAVGRDAVPYEFIKHGGENMVLAITLLIQQIFDEEKIPESWNKLLTISLPKGKKNPEYLDNKRGITLSSNVEKIFERVLINRVSKIVPFTEAQAGARKGRATHDQIFTLKPVLNERKQRGNATYLAFLDVQKAYDSMWGAAVVKNLWERGVRGKMWRVLKALNEGKSTQIATRFGLTDDIMVRESLRQGGVASPIEFAALMDQLAVDLEAEGLHVDYHGIKISCLLLMDDVVLIADNPKQLQSMLDAADRLALRAHLSYNQTKSKIMVVNGKANNERIWFLGEHILEETDRYTYLGETLTNDLRMTGHLGHLTQRSFGVSSNMFAVASEPTLAKIKIQTLIQLYQTCWIPAILHGCETWMMDRSALERLKALQLNIVKQIFKAPKSALISALLGETGILPIQYEIQKRQMMYLYSLLNTTKQALTILRIMIEEIHSGTWWQHVKENRMPMSVDP